MVPRDLISTTWYLNKTRIRTWDHFPVLVKIEEREMRVRKGKKGWAGWTPVSYVEEKKFQEHCLCPAGKRSWVNDEEGGGLVALQARLEGAAAEVKATTMASRNRKKFMVPDEIREMVVLAAQCWDPREEESPEEEGTESSQRVRRQSRCLAQRQSHQEARDDEALGQWKGHGRQRGVE